MLRSTGVATWGGTPGLGMIDVADSVWVVACSAGGLGTGLVRLIMPSLLAPGAPDAWQLKRLLVVLLPPLPSPARPASAAAFAIPRKA